MDEVTSEAPPPRDEELLPGGYIPYVECPSCGRSIILAASFCPYCGRQVVESPGAEPTAGRVPWTVLDMGKAIGFIIVGVLVAFIPLAVAIYLVAGSDPDENDATYLTISIGSSVVLQILMLLAAVRFGIGKYRVPWSTLGLRRPGPGGYWLPVPLVISAYGIMFLYFAVLGVFGIEPDADLPDGTFDNIGPIIAVFVLSVVFAPFVEEVFFRGYIFGGLRAPWGVALAAIASATLWGAVHAANPGSFYIVPPIVGIGVLFAWAYLYSGSLFASIGAHLLFNLTSFIIGLTTQ